MQGRIYWVPHLRRRLQCNDDGLRGRNNNIGITQVGLFIGLALNFKNDFARLNGTKFANRQLRNLLKVSKKLSRIDIHDRGVHANNQLLDRFVEVSWNLLASYKQCNTPDPNHSFNTNTDDMDDNGLLGGLKQAYNTEHSKLWNDALVSYFVALANLSVCCDVKHLEILPRLNFGLCNTSAVVSLLGAFHKLDMHKLPSLGGIIDNCFSHFTNNNSVMKRLNAREISLLLWRRAALLYVGDAALLPVHASQIKVLMNHCYNRIQEYFVYKGNSGNSLVKYLQSILDDRAFTLSMPPSNSFKTSNDILKHPEPMNIRQTLSHVSRSCAIIFNFKCANRPILEALSISTLSQLEKLLLCSVALHENSLVPSSSSDTHIKVAIATRDAVGRDFEMIQEYAIGSRIYSIDLLLQK